MRPEQLGKIEGLKTWPVEHEGMTFDAEDFTVYALLSDPIYMAELLWEDQGNRAYEGCYKVRDYQYPLFRAEDHYEILACARSVGKTESVKARSQSHVFRRIGHNLLLTAPELIHLLPLTDAIEDNLRASRLTRELLDTRNQGTGFQHRPFQANFIDKTKIVGRIPKLTGTGVKGQHQPDLIVDEGQDYPEKGYTEVNETVMKDILDHDGEPDFHFHVYGVHSGDRAGAFFRLTSQGGFNVTTVTALMRPDWNKSQKEAAKAMYGGTQSPDYRRNILGEPGAASSAFFVIARLMACVDQGKTEGQPDTSPYNTHEYRHIELRAEELDDLELPIGEILDLPSGYGKLWVGADLGLTDAPTVVVIFAEQKTGNRVRLKLIRRLTLWRFRTRQIREAMYAIGWKYGGALKGFGVDSTGIGFPIMQDMEDDEAAPPILEEVMRGYFFNSKVPVNVQKEFVSEDSQGNLRDQYGSVVKIEEDPLTGTTRYVTFQPMIEASTRYLREFVDPTFLMLPFDPEVVTDMQGETQQRVQRVAGMRKKPNAFHILDAMRAMAMVYKSGDIEESLAEEEVQPVMESAVEVEAGPVGGVGMDSAL